MVKIHTRQKRKMRFRGAPKEARSPRSRSFNSEEVAIAYAKEQGLKNYKLVDVHSERLKNKIKIILE